jgi:hypothetical protein
MVTLNGALNRETRPRASSPLPPTLEAYARNFTIPTARSRPKTVARCNHNASTRKSLAPPETPPRHHQQAPNSARPHHQGGAGSTLLSKRSTAILPKCSLPIDGRLLYQSSYGFASGQIHRRSEGTLLPSSGEPKVSNPWNNVQRKDSI